MTNTKNLRPVRDDQGNGVGVVEFSDARATRSPWVAHTPGWYPTSHALLENAERAIIQRSADA